jgi:uncharacterized protein (TIGR00290 family)
MSSNILLSWSGGKDSALALERLQYNGEYRPIGLFTAYDKESGKVKLHNVPIELIRMQAESVGLPLYELPLSSKASNDEYEKAHLDLFAKLKKEDLESVAFGDIHLEVIRQYREQLSAKAELPFVYPLWGESPEYLSQDFIERDFKAVITAIDTAKMTKEKLGSIYDLEFVAGLPGDVDVCGENGEFHSFVFDGPNFSRRIGYKTGKIFEEDYRPEVNMTMAFLEIERG